MSAQVTGTPPIGDPFRMGVLDRDGEDLVDGVQLEVFDVPVSVPLVVTTSGAGRPATDASVGPGR